MEIVAHLKSSKKRSEQSQSIARVVIGFLVLLFIAYSKIQNQDSNDSLTTALYVIGAYWLFSIGFSLYIHFYPQPMTLRKIVGIFGDIAIISFGMVLLDRLSPIVFPLLLWVIIGNGLRFGVYYLYLAMFAGVVGTVIVYNYSNYWQTNAPLTVGVLLAIVVLPLFYATVLRELQASNEKLHQQVMETQHAATHDALTGLANRVLFREQLNNSMERANKDKNLLIAILFIDLDKFKFINDNYGHDTGDKLLCLVGERISSKLRQNDLVARIGGDEFIVLLNNLSHEKHLEALAKRMLNVFRSEYKINDHHLIVTGSVGMGIFPRDGKTLDELINNADRAMYKAKRQGGNSFSAPVRQQA